MRFLVNPAYHNRVVQGKPQEATGDRRLKYKKRIHELHQSMMKGESPEAGLKAAHDAFVGSAIRYIRLDQAQQLVQDDLADVALPSKKTSAGEADTFDITDQTVKTLGRAPPARTIDSFVVRTSRAAPMPPPPRRPRVRARPLLPAGARRRRRPRAAGPDARGGAQPRAHPRHEPEPRPRPAHPQEVLHRVSSTGNVGLDYVRICAQRPRARLARGRRAASRSHSGSLVGGGAGLDASSVRPVSRKDYDDALCQVRASVSQADLKAFDDWNKQYGSFANHASLASGK